MCVSYLEIRNVQNTTPIVPSFAGEFTKMCAVVLKKLSDFGIEPFSIFSLTVKSARGAWAGPWAGPAACAHLQPVGL